MGRNGGLGGLLFGDRDGDGGRLDDLVGVGTGVANVGRRALFGGLSQGDTVGEQFSNLPGGIADTYESGAQAGNHAVDDVGAWWDSL